MDNSISVKNIVVGNKFHGKGDVTAGGTLANPTHKLTEKLDSVYKELDAPWTEVDTLWENGDYPTEEGKLIKYNNQFYRAKSCETVTLDFTKITESSMTWNDLANWINTQYVLLRPEECVYHETLDYDYHVFISDEENSNSTRTLDNGLLVTQQGGLENEYIYFKTDGRNNGYPSFSNPFTLVLDKIDITVRLNDGTAGTSDTFCIYGDDNNGIENGINIPITRDSEGKGVSKTITFDSSKFNMYSPISTWCYTDDYSNNQYYIEKMVITFKHYENGSYEERSGSTPIIYVPITEEEITKDDYRLPVASDRKIIARTPLDNLYHADSTPTTLLKRWERIYSIDDFESGKKYLLVSENQSEILDGNSLATDVSGVTKGATIVTGTINYIELNDDINDSYYIITKKENNKYSIKSKVGEYIGSLDDSGAKNTFQHSTTDDFDNELFISTYSNYSDVRAQIRPTGYEDDTNYMLTINGKSTAAGAQGARFYRAPQSKKGVRLYKYVEREVGYPYEWSELVKKEELKTVAFTGNYEDLTNKPLHGDIIVNDYPSGLPTPSLDYKYILGRYDNSLYTIAIGSGWDFNPVRYADETTSTGVTREALSAYYNKYMPSTHFITNNFVLDGTLTPVKTQGIRFGSGSKTGTIHINMLEPNYQTHTYQFNQIELSFLPYVKSTGLAEVGKVDISIGYASNLDVTGITPTIYATGSVEFEADTEPVEKSIVLSSETVCNYIKIATDGDVGRRIVMTKFWYDDLKYWVSSEEEYIIKNRIIWKKIAGDGGSTTTPYVNNRTLYL